MPPAGCVRVSSEVFRSKDKPGSSSLSEEGLSFQTKLRVDSW